MKRLILLASLVGVGALSVAAFQQPPANAPKVVEVEKLRDNLWMLKGGGGNTAVFVRANGITIVDTKNPGWGQPILDAVKKLSDKPVTQIINTHTHGDHVSGNVEMPVNVEIIVQDNTKKNMEEMRGATGIAQNGPPTNIFKEHNGRGMPTKTFKDRMTVNKGADEIDLYYFGRGHTNGDAWVVFPALRLVHAGDIFSGRNIPLLDANNGGSGVEIGSTLEKAAKSLKNIDTIITGHSTTMTMADLSEYAQFNKDFMTAVQAEKKAGKSADQIAAAWKLPAKYKGYADPTANDAGKTRLKANVQIVLDETK
ncbi:MAG TPA: MBL fold metallo-hydrolase [Vicinamibacterales bacterium]|nr:MBL fold metallo-hydrolase [Vicinamibacterales bacterium]